MRARVRICTCVGGKDQWVCVGVCEVHICLYVCVWCVCLSKGKELYTDMFSVYVCACVRLCCICSHFVCNCCVCAARFVVVHGSPNVGVCV